MEWKDMGKYKINWGRRDTSFSTLPVQSSKGENIDLFDSESGWTSEQVTTTD